MERSQVIKQVNNIGSDEGHNWTLKVYNSMRELPRGYVLQFKDPWCAAFVTAVLSISGYDGINECSCNLMMNKASKAGIYKEKNYNAAAGDVIFYNWDSDSIPDHVGIIIDTSDGDYLVREGNKGGKVDNRRIVKESPCIMGFASIPYNDYEFTRDKMSRVMERLQAIDYEQLWNDRGIDGIISEVDNTIKEGLR